MKRKPKVNPYTETKWNATEYVSPRRSWFWLVPCTMGILAGFVGGYLCGISVNQWEMPKPDPLGYHDLWKVKCQKAYRLLRKGQCTEAYEELDR